LKIRNIVLFILITACFISCGSTPRFSSVTKKEWKLVKVFVEETPVNRTITYDRGDLKKENIDNIFTITFSSDSISGTGAPNRYSASYSTGSNQAITIRSIRSTTNAALVQPEKLQEQTFYVYLQNASKWNVVDKNLEIVSKTEDGKPVKMVFGLFK